MACFFGHKWQGCKCAKCGKVRDQEHDFRHVSECEDRCARCGKTVDKHRYVKGYCERCGKMSPTPFDLSGLTAQEIDAARRAITIAKQANKDPKLTPAYAHAEQSLTPRKLNGDDIAITALSLLTVSKALLESVATIKNNAQEQLARMTLGLQMQQALGKVNQLMTDFNQETERRKGKTADAAGAEEAAPVKDAGQDAGNSFSQEKSVKF